MSSVWNNRISVSVFGEAQSNAIGVTINNLPAGEYIDAKAIKKFMLRTGSGNRMENIMPHIVSGIFNERTTGTPVCAFIQNYTPEPIARDENIDRLARCGHADYTGAVRYRGFNDVRDGGHFSERLTIPLCFAGALCGQILERRGIYTGSHIARIHKINDNPFDEVNLNRDHIISIRNKDFPVISDRKGWLMLEEIERIRKKGDSLGGVIECASVNVPAGIGSPIFDGLENTIAQLAFGIPFVTGIEFGAGFKSATMTGSLYNDEFYFDSHGHVLTKTNNHGGILGGISSGMPVVFRVAVRPNPSVAKLQKTVDMHNMTDETFTAGNDYEPCTVARAVPAVEAVANIALLTHMMDYPNFC
ncbi:MAG: chorismate synthase [Ruminococcus flavefaciens]|nr:chorismate synthase [Ruminococcus flavefaciens]